jgi:hypothetical protein
VSEAELKATLLERHARLLPDRWLYSDSAIRAEELYLLAEHFGWQDVVEQMRQAENAWLHDNKKRHEHLERI